MRGFWLVIFLVLVASGVMLGMGASAEAVLRVRPHIVAGAGSEVHFSSVIEAHDLPADVIQQIGRLTLTTAPDEGEKRTVTSHEITELLRPIVQDLRDRGLSLRLVVPQSVVIDTLKRELDAGEVKDELLQAWRSQCADCHLEIEGLSLPRVRDLRDWTVHVNPELPRGSFSVPVDLVRQDGQLTPAWISGRLVIKRRVPVARRLISFGERVLATDFTWEYRDTSFAYDGIPQNDELSGKRLKQSLRAGDILWGSQLERERAVRRGDLVQLRSAEGSWEVSMSVVAQQDGFVGDVISLKNPRSNTMLMGQVTAPGEVELR